jgi:hypothetical protein
VHFNVTGAAASDPSSELQPAQAGQQLAKGHSKLAGELARVAGERVVQMAQQGVGVGVGRGLHDAQALWDAERVVEDLARP